MHSSVRRSTPLLAIGLLFLVVCSSPIVCRAQDDPERAHAFQLYDDGKYAEALPLFAKLFVKYPEDPDVLKVYGFLTIGESTYLKDPAARKDGRRRGRELLVKAQKLGADDALLKTMLASIAPDGGDDVKLTTKKEAEDAMREGEAAFSKNDFAKAIERYQAALLLDPNLYEAAVFIGDVYFATADQKKAGEWFAHAAAMDPDRETAYRYWGDSLMKQGRVSEAGDKFIESYLAEPYSRLSRAAFLSWGERVNIEINHPEVNIPTNVTAQQSGQVTINLDPNSLKKDDKNGAGAAWLLYGLVRGGWQGANFSKQYPNEKTYRHSLKEEADALRAAIKSYEESQKKNPKSAPDPSLQVLLKLDKEGLLEPFILLALPDEGIAQDYREYRRTNLDDLRRYVKQYVLTGGGK
jgi:tetratricopeptide (TPR) repeat protein